MTTAADMAANDRLIRLPEVLAKTGLARSTILRLVAAGKFPRQHKLLDSGARNAPVAWSLAEVSAWVASRQNTPNATEE